MEKFYIGLDVGTNSCGIAATDEDYSLLRFKGKDMWTVSLFDEAQSAAKRRGFRTLRRRLFRRTQRIDLLQDLLADEIAKVDSLFFLRLNNSALLSEDKDERLNGAVGIFCDDDYTDKDFYKKYPTIYHLRRALIDGTETEIRHFYLGLHHIIKYRGHFLFEEKKVDEIDDIAPVFREINDFIADNFDEDVFVLSEESVSKYTEFVKGEKTNLKTAIKRAEDIFGLSTKREKEFAKAICGGTFKLSVLFDNEDYAESEADKISFKDGKSDEKFALVEAECGDDAELVFLMKKVYDWALLAKVLDGESSVSAAMIKLYEKHNTDLKLLKSLVKAHMPDEYANIFRTVDNDRKDDAGRNYCSYAGISNGRYVKRCTQEVFYTFLKKTFKKYESELTENDEYRRICDDMEKENFLPRISDADNGVMPQQLNYSELVAILANLEKNYPELALTDENGLSKTDKIKRIFTFKIPYYIGPLVKNDDETKKSNAWIVKKKDERVLPWNFDEIVDTEATAEKFIRRMTNKCSFIRGADVLPKSSLTYSKFSVLNQLNKLTIDAKPLSVALKQDIFNELFLKDKKPTKKKLIRYLVKNSVIEKGYVPSIGGIDKDFTSFMSSYVTFANIIGRENVERYYDEIEEIISILTIFNDRTMAEKAIMKRYGQIPCIAENIKVIKGLTFKDFGTLSKELLTGIYAFGGEESEGELPVTVMDVLWNTNKNLMEAVNAPEYGFSEEIKARNGELSDVFRYEDLDDYYLSPAVRRGVWRALVMTDEYVKAVGKAPDKIFVEVTRGDDKEKKRKSSRKEDLLNFYKANQKYIEDYDKLINELNKKNESELRQERLYLYFKQLGKCMYSGKKIDLEDLSTDLYDIDHIIPRALKKDDSVHNNKVLVLREYNKKKGDVYPLPEEWQKNNGKFWTLLKSLKIGKDDTGVFLNAEKYARLTRKDPFTDDELQEFVNRQLTFTGQSATALARILKIKYRNTKVVFSKAENVSAYRDRYKMYKNREVNDLHHARDAYLNIVVGNVFDARFSGNPKNYLYVVEANGKKHRYNLTKIYNYNVKGAWDKETTKDKVKSVYDKNSMTVVRMSVITRGGFYKQTHMPKGQGTVPVKWSGALSDIDKYGGYNTLSTAYFSVVESVVKKGKKEKTIKTIEAIPVYYDRMASIGKITIKEYLEKIVGLNSAKILFSHIKVKSLLKFNGTLVYLSGGGCVSDSRLQFHNANQWFIREKDSDYLRIVSKAVNRSEELKDKAGQDEILVCTSRDGKRKDYVKKSQNGEIYELIYEQLGKEIYKGVTAFGSVRQIMKDGKEIFDELNNLEQCEVLIKIVAFLQCKGLNADLVKIGGSGRSGIMRTGNDVTQDEVLLINYSPAGLYKNVVVINKPDK